MVPSGAAAGSGLGTGVGGIKAATTANKIRLAYSHCLAATAKNAASVVPSGLQSVTPYPALEVLGYNTLPLPGLNHNPSVITIVNSTY